MLVKIATKLFGEDSNLVLGINKAKSLPLIPSKVEDFNNKIIVRILRVIGGLSLILTLANKSATKEGTLLFDGLPSFVIWTISGFAIAQFIYILVMVSIKNYYILYHIKHKNYEVRNSPIKPVASLLGKTYLCFKGACQNAGVAGGLIGAFYACDALLIDTNRDPVFKPFVARHGNKILTTMGWPEKSPDIRIQEDKPSQSFK